MSEVPVSHPISDDDHVFEQGARNGGPLRDASAAAVRALTTIISTRRARAALAGVALGGCLVFATPSYAADETFTCQTYEGLYNQQAAAVLEAVGLTR